VRIGKPIVADLKLALAFESIWVAAVEKKEP